MLVQCAFRFKNKIIYTKRMSYTKAKLLGMDINHRQIERNEIVFDIDAPDRQKSYQVMDYISARLCCDEYTHKVYDTGNKGYHIHLIIPELGDYKYGNRKNIRRLFMTYYSNKYKEYIDYQKVSDKVMIRLENSIHERTGKKKRCIFEANFDKEENTLPLWIKELVEGIIVKRETSSLCNIDWQTSNKVLNWCLNNRIPDGNRNIWLFKNLAILIMELGLENNTALISKIHQNTGERRKDIYGWIRFFKKKGTYRYNRKEVEKWFRLHGIEL